MYKSVNDAAIIYSGLQKGSTQVWYLRPEMFRNFSMGYAWAKEREPRFSPNTLSNTHILLGEIQETDLDKIFGMMQGEFWSPKGEAFGLMGSLGLHHTSLSVGDIIVVGGVPYMVEGCGFKDISDPSSVKFIKQE